MIYILILDILPIKCSIAEFLGCGLDEWPKSVSGFKCREIVGLTRLFVSKEKWGLGSSDMINRSVRAIEHGGFLGKKAYPLVAHSMKKPRLSFQ